MKFDLTSPCGNCPFRYDRPGYLSADRVAEITDALFGGSTFSCHKLNDTDEDGEVYEGPEAQHCAGALIFLEANETSNQLMRVAERLGLYDSSKLNMDAPVFTDTDAMQDHQPN